MGKMLIKSQNGNDTWFVDGISIGVRQPKLIFGTKLLELMRKNNITKEQMIDICGNSYADSLNRIYENKEIPKNKLYDKIINYFGVERDFFLDKELQNVLITSERLVVAEYKTEKRTKEVKEKLDDFIMECYRTGKPIIINFPEE